MNAAFIILAIMDFMAELFHLTYQCGALTRRYALPVIVAAAVVTHMVWEEIVKFYDSHPPFTLEMGYNMEVVKG